VTRAGSLWARLAGCALKQPTPVSADCYQTVIISGEYLGFGTSEQDDLYATVTLIIFRS